MLQSPHGLWEGCSPGTASFAASSPAAHAELSYLTLLDSDSDCSDSEAPTPRSPAAAPCLMQLTMDEVAAAARAALPPSLPTCALLAQLFPSAAGCTACVPSADGLGFAVSDLLPRGCCAKGACPPRGGRGAQPQLVEPLPGGGLLAFACAHPPAEVERALMHAFAAELSDRLRPRGAADSKASLLSLLGAAPLHAQPAATPHDAFWAPF